MTTNFALVLSFEGIELLHRVPRGWKPVGRTANVEDPELDSLLAALREQALALEPDGLRTKIVIPMDQIKYLAIDSTLTDMDDIYRVLDGTTPYALKDLVIDYEKSGGRTHVAAVARETLYEAEVFSRAHKFNPVSFVAIPEPFTFQKEVFFGPTNMMQEVLGPDGRVARDALPVMRVGTRIKSRMLVFDLPEEDLPADDGDLGALLTPEKPETELPPVPDIDLAALLAPHVSDAAPTESRPVSEPEPEASPAQPVAALWIDRIVPEYVLAEVSVAPEPAIISQPEAAPVAPDLSEPLVKDERDVTEAILPLSAVAEARPIPEPVAPVQFDPVISEYHAAQRAVAKKPVPVLTAQPPGTPASLPKLDPVGLSRPSALNIPDTPRNHRPLYLGGALAACLALVGVLGWTQFGPSQDAPVQAEPLSAEAPVVAAEDRQALLQPVADVTALPAFDAVTPVSAAAAPPALAADIQDALPEPVAAAPNAPEATAPVPEENAQASVGAPILRGRVLSPDEATQIYNATGVWQRAARPAPLPPMTTLADLIRPVTVPAPAPLAQPQSPALQDLQTDLSFLAPADPPPAEVVFPVDENGFILATPEGTPTPEGAMVFAGLPDLNVRPRPELSEEDLARMEMLSPAPEGVVIVAGRPTVTPPLRPEDASLPEPDAAPETVEEENTLASVPTADDAAEPASEDNATETASLRPEARPGAEDLPVASSNPDITSIIAGITNDEDDDAPEIDPDIGTVAASRRPETRPQNFARVVSAARARQAAQQEAQEQQQASAAAAPVQTAAPVAPQNYAPVPGGVARAATQEDVIRLRDLNLIGVYGRPNARRALVRLPNGRFVRVEVGSPLDGGQVTAIGDGALNYVKRGRTYALELPSG